LYNASFKSIPGFKFQDKSVPYLILSNHHSTVWKVVTEVESDRACM